MVMPPGRFAVDSAFCEPRAVEPRHYRRIVEGVLLHWVEFGETSSRPRGKTPVVLLHGLNDSHLTWRRIAPELARNRRVLVLDLPGHGDSDRPDAGYELAWYARVVAGWIEALGLAPREQVDIVGHSFGGGIAMMLLQVCRPRVRRLVLAAPGGLGKEILFLLRLASIPGVVECFGQPFMALGTRLVLRPWRGKLPIGHIAQLSAMNSRRGSARAFGRTVRGLMNWSGQRHSFYRHAHEIVDLPPIAVLWGDRDAVLPIAHGKALVQGMEGVKLTELTGCGHYLHHDDPKSFLMGVREALDAFSWPRVRVTAAASASWRATGGAPDSRSRWSVRLGGVRSHSSTRERSAQARSRPCSVKPAAV
jgi:pimeloyl-ACP methyl ester carboxylesterase